jgi:hypothetical protein
VRLVGVTATRPGRRLSPMSMPCLFQADDVGRGGQGWGTAVAAVLRLLGVLRHASESEVFGILKSRCCGTSSTFLFGAAGLPTAQAGPSSVQATRSRPVLTGRGATAQQARIRTDFCHRTRQASTVSPSFIPGSVGFAELPTDPGRVRDCTYPALVDHSGPSTVRSGLGSCR